MSESERAPTPCVGECRLTDGICSGCGRTIEEITRWIYYSEADKKKILDRLKGFEEGKRNSDKLNY